MLRKLTRLLIFVLCFWIFLEVNNNWLQTSHYDVSSERVPAAFDGFTIVQISDLHDAQFGEKQSRLANKIKKIDPDVVFLTGDLIDSNRYDLQNSLDLVEQLTPITEVFYVLGNHEVAINEVEEITESLANIGVHVLRNESITLEKNKEYLRIAGIDDPMMRMSTTSKEATSRMITETLQHQSTYTLLLAHRPEMFETYVEHEVDVVFSGHAHGGQIRIPGVGGLIAPGQGMLPTYTSGKHEQGNTTMVVSRGLGNSVFPFRIFNLPEIVVVTLKHAKME